MSDARVQEKHRLFAKTIARSLAEHGDLEVIAVFIADLMYSAADEAYRAGVLSARQGGAE